MFENYRNWTISSQAFKELEEGSTHNSYSPDRTMKGQERGAVEILMIYAELYGNIEKIG